MFLSAVKRRKSRGCLVRGFEEVGIVCVLERAEMEGRRGLGGAMVSEWDIAPGLSSRRGGGFVLRARWVGGLGQAEVGM